MVQLESRMEAEDYRKLRGLFTVGSGRPRVPLQPSRGGSQTLVGAWPNHANLPSASSGTGWCCSACLSRLRPLTVASL